MTTDATLNGVALSTAVPAAIITNVRRQLVGRRRHRVEDIPGRAGPWVYTEEPGSAVLELAVHLQADTFADRRAAVDDLADWVDVGAVAALILDDQADRYYEAILDDAPQPEEWLNAGEADLRFLVGPYRLAVATSSQSITATGGTDSDTFTIPDTIAAEPIIEVTGLNGTLTGFTLTVNGDALTYAGPTIGTGNTVTISSISDTVTQGVNGDTMLTGAYTGTVTLADVSGAFPELRPGSNAWSITWTGTATNVRIRITWRRRFR